MLMLITNSNRLRMKRNSPKRPPITQETTSYQNTDVTSAKRSAGKNTKTNKNEALTFVIYLNGED